MLTQNSEKIIKNIKKLTQILRRKLKYKVTQKFWKKSRYKRCTYSKFWKNIFLKDVNSNSEKKIQI